MTDLKDDLHRYLQHGRDALLWKLEGVGEYDVRRPLTPTGTNLLGLVKHLACVEIGYFGDAFGRARTEVLPWDVEGSDPHDDLFARADETVEDVVAFYRRAWAHADATIGELSLEDLARVPWWPAETSVVPLGRLLVHVATETHRHAGHADVLRELLDGAAGLRRENDNLGLDDPSAFADHHARVERTAREAADRRARTGPPPR